MKPALVDFHYHLDLYPSLESAVHEAEEAGIYTLAVTTTPKAWPRNFEITRLTRHVRAGLGLHPQLVAERHSEIALWESYLPQTRYVGEVGLDAGPRYYRSFDLQKQVFEHILKQCAKAEARRAAELGCYFSVNAAMLTKERGRDLVAALPLERLLTETDGPFTQIDGRPTCPADVESTIGALANLFHFTPDVMAMSVHTNLRALLSAAGVSTDK